MKFMLLIGILFLIVVISANATERQLLPKDSIYIIKHEVIDTDSLLDALSVNETQQQNLFKKGIINTTQNTNEKVMNKKLLPITHVVSRTLSCKMKGAQFLWSFGFNDNLAIILILF